VAIQRRPGYSMPALAFERMSLLEYQLV